MADEAAASVTDEKAGIQIEADLSTPDGAAAYEAAIRRRALELRALRTGEAGQVQLWTELEELLRLPIPQAYLNKVPAIKGKPYDSIGIQSVQVQIDRMNNVLGPENWSDEITYWEGGKVCSVEVTATTPTGALIERMSYGGVDYASNLGNLHKGSYTNAAKVAFARVGPGHEVYIGLDDLDPDVSRVAAEAQAEGAGIEVKPPVRPITQNEIDALGDEYLARQVKPEDWQMFLLSYGVEKTAELPESAFHSAMEFLTKHEKRINETETNDADVQGSEPQVE